MKALVTNCTRNSGLTVMRALSRAGWRVEGADDRVFAFGLRSRSAIAPYRALPTEDDPRFADALLALLERTRPDVLIPTRGIEAACRQRDAVLGRTHCLLPTMAAFEVLNDKMKLLESCAALGLDIPRVFELDAAVRFLQSAPGSQVVIKPRRDIGGGVGVHFVGRPEELVKIHGRVVAEHGGALISEYIPGPTENLRAVHLLFDSASRLIAFFILRKLRIWPKGVGITVAAVSTHEVDLVENLLPLFSELKWQGPADAELKIDARDGKAKLIEINPRFSGAIHFPIACGVNMPLLYCEAALGRRMEEASSAAYPPSMYYLDGIRWVSSVIADLREPGAKWSAILGRVWRDELHRPRVPSVHALGDPGPALGKLWTTSSYD